MVWKITSLIFHRPKQVLSSISNPFSRHRILLSTVPANSTNLKTLYSNGQLNEALLELGIQGFEVEFQGYDSVLTECINQNAIREGQRVQAHMIKTCYEPPVYLRTRLIVFYNKCGNLGDARRVFDEMPERNVVSWTAMISGYSHKGYASEALHLFVEMLTSGNFSFIFLLDK